MTVAIRGELHPVGEAARHVEHEGVGGFRVVVAHQPTDDQLAVGVERGPRPHVARGGGRGSAELWGNVGRMRIPTKAATNSNLIAATIPI